MNKIYFLLIFFAFSHGVSGQNTWVRKLTYNYPAGSYWDSLTGVKHIEVGPDGSVYVLAHTNADNNQFIYKFSPNSNQVEWSVFAGNDGMSVDSWTDIFHVTKDSGIVTCINAYGMYKNGSVTKYTKEGSQIFLNSHTGSFAPDYATIVDVIERKAGGYYMLTPDSLFILDASGGIMDTVNFYGGKAIRELPGGDLLFYNGNTLTRYDTALNIIWTQPCSGPFDFDSTSVFIKHGASNIKKVDAATGIQDWNILSPFSLISDLHATNEGGFMACTGYEPTGVPFWPFTANVVPGHLFKVDSLGDTLWTRTYNLPRYGLYSFSILPNGNIFTGGGYLSGPALGPQKDFSAFVCVMNSDGSYPLAQTSYISGGDANNDHFMNFTDDALQIMLALTHSGSPRDSSVDGNSDPGYLSCGSSNIAIDWPTFSGGVNDKYSDADGNGVIDTNDVHVFDYAIYCNDSIALYYRLSNPDLLQTVEEFNFVPVNDTILPGDSPEYYLIMGSNANPVDSVYGFAVSYFINEDGQNNIDSTNFYSSTLGSLGVDLFNMQGLGLVANYKERQHTLLCRTDFQNAINVNDTVGFIRFGGWFNSANIQLTIADFKAILVDGTEIPFNVSAGSIFIDSSSVRVNEIENDKVKVYPNPADKELKIKNEKLIIGEELTVEIFNLPGEKIKTIQNFIPGESISVSDLPDGFYTGRISSDTMTGSFSFVISH
jgi:hypothetical protein